MGIRLISNGTGGMDSVAMYDSVSGWAFGPVFPDEETALGFIAYVEQHSRTDPRKLNDANLAMYLDQFRTHRKRQWNEDDDR